MLSGAVTARRVELDVNARLALPNNGAAVVRWPAFMIGQRVVLMEVANVSLSADRRGIKGDEQMVPVNPASQTHVPSGWQTPRPPHAAGHVVVSGVASTFEMPHVAFAPVAKTEIQRNRRVTPVAAATDTLMCVHPAA